MADGKHEGTAMTFLPAGDARVVRIAAALIVDPAGKMLLVRKRGTQAFMQAGGKIEPSETPREALSRELAEELRIDLDSALHDFIGHFAAQAAHEEDCVVSADIFYVQIPGTVTPAAEIEEIAWIDPFALTSNGWAARAPANPNPSPVAVRRPAFRSTNRVTSLGVAPKATRIANSRVREAAMKAMTP